MTIGIALLVIAAGAVLRFAVTARVSGINIATLGDVLIAVGVLGFLISLGLLVSLRRRRTTVVEQQTYPAPPAAVHTVSYPTRVEERRYSDPPL